MESNNKNDDQLKRTDEDLLEDGEFGPEVFEDEPEEVLADAPGATDAQETETNQVKQSKLPWILFAASLIAIIAILLIGNSGLDGAAAKVNGDKVTKEELYQAMLNQGGDAALDSLISEKLIVQEAKKKNVKVAEQEIETELKEIKAKFPDEQQFNDTLAQYHMTLDALKGQIRTQLLMSKLFEGQMDLSETKLKEFFEQNKSHYGTAEQVEVSHILVDKKEDADKLLADLKGGADFAQIAKENSKDPGSKDNGGSLGFVARGQGLDQAFEDAAFKLNKGELSPVVQSSFGYHIIKATDKKQAAEPNFDEKKEQIRKDMVQEEINAKGAEFMENLKKDAKIEKL